jgi:hypothetical protein
VITLKKCGPEIAALYDYEGKWRDILDMVKDGTLPKVDPKLTYPFNLALILNNTTVLDPIIGTYFLGARNYCKLNNSYFPPKLEFHQSFCELHATVLIYNATMEKYGTTNPTRIAFIEISRRINGWVNAFLEQDVPLLMSVAVLTSYFIYEYSLFILHHVPSASQM